MSELRGRLEREPLPNGARTSCYQSEAAVGTPRKNARIVTSESLNLEEVLSGSLVPEELSSGCLVCE